MRVAFVSVSDQLGGSEAMLLQTAAELRTFKPDWELHLVVPGTGPLGARATAPRHARQRPADAGIAGTDG